jgi:Uma2 family endonuclease
MAAKTLMTAAEFAKTGSETDGYELVRGELVPIPPPAKNHGYVSANAVFLLGSHTKKRGKGIVMCNDTGLITRRRPDTVRGVDVMVYVNPKTSGRDIPDGYAKEPPDLAVEIRSPSQSWKELMEKVLEYLNMGVRLVWVVDPKVKRVTVFSQDSEPQTFAAENELDGGDVLPGFRCKVAEFFA